MFSMFSHVFVNLNFIYFCFLLLTFNPLMFSHALSFQQTVSFEMDVLSPSAKEEQVSLLQGEEEEEDTSDIEDF